MLSSPSFLRPNVRDQPGQRLGATVEYMYLLLISVWFSPPCDHTNGLLAKDSKNKQPWVEEEDKAVFFHDHTSLIWQTTYETKSFTVGCCGTKQQIEQWEEQQTHSAAQEQCYLSVNPTWMIGSATQPFRSLHSHLNDNWGRLSLNSILLKGVYKCHHQRLCNLGVLDA